ncbi:MAG: hypothetical protein VZR28_11550, partial [Candidatus Cryptobacteroides sp.]|nr:hypothetical protein [Candidatus Cryptobacteroides sp.]
MKTVAKGDSDIETPAEFAFGAGQLASYLIDRSVASNKTYAMLEPYSLIPQPFFFDKLQTL